MFNESAIKAQEKIDDIQGKDRLWFCGAYQRYGFHEDGLLSAVNLAKRDGSRNHHGHSSTNFYCQSNAQTTFSKRKLF